MLPNGTDGQSTASAPAAPSDALPADWGAFFSGGMVADDESPEPENQNAGAPPASGVNAPENVQGRSEGATDDALAGAPPAEATAPTPDGEVPNDDPLAGATPFTYRVNGEERTFDGIRVVGQHGAIIEPDALQRVQQRLSERDNLFERSQALFQQHQANEDRWTKLTSWSVGKDPQGNERVLTGEESLEAQRVLTARAIATNQVLSTILDPQHFARYVEVLGDEQTGYQIVPRQEAIDALKVSIENAVLKADGAARAQFARLRSALAPTPQSGAPSSGSSPASASVSSGNGANAGMTPEQALSTVKGLTAGVQGLTDDDHAALAELLPRFVRAATPSERFQHGTDLIVDGSFAKQIDRAAAVRKSMRETTTATQDAATRNARTLTQALQGQPRRGQPTTPARQPAKPTQKSDADKAWELRERLAQGQLGTAGSL